MDSHVPVKAVIFDCFGVLVGKGFWDIYRSAGGDPVKDAEFIEDILYRASAGTISGEEFRSSIASQIGITVEAYEAAVNRDEHPDMELFDYIRSELKPHYKIALLSNVNRGVIEHKIPAELRSLFDVEILSAEVGVQKPDPRIFEMTIQKLDVDYNETIFIDDRQKYLTPAAELGMNTVRYTDFRSCKTQLETLLHNKR